MSDPNKHPRKYKDGSKSYGYNESPANDYSYNKNSSRTNSYQLGELPSYDQPPPPHEAVPKSYGYSERSAPVYTYDHRMGGESFSQPVPKSKHETNKVSKWFTSKVEERRHSQALAEEEKRYRRALAKEDELQQETWDRRFPTIMPQIQNHVFPILPPGFHGNLRLKDDRRISLEDQIGEWKEQGQTRWKILKLREEWRLQEAEIDKAADKEYDARRKARSRFE
ncbi:MAG: hypothetical protein Q9212_005079 [Teloschistes hypoglaucus]